MDGGSLHTCALTTSGGVQCWGDNSHGQLGDGTTTDSTTPVDVIGLSSGVSAIATGGYYTCALLTDGTVECWGDNSYGQLGNNSTTDSSTPVTVSGLGSGSGVTAIAAGGGHTCVRINNGTVQCWGVIGNGQLGDGTTTQHLSPNAISGLTGIVTVTAGLYHSCALTSGGAVKCWGVNSFGELGDASVVQRTSPVDVSGLSSGVTAIAADGFTTCAVVSGAAECWGYNVYGQVGDNSTTSRNVPTAVSSLGSGVSALALGFHHACALTTGGAVKCWGHNATGELGDGTTTDSHTPVNVSGLTSGVSLIAAGDSHTCALVANSGIQCWGYNSNGQLGDGTTADRNTAVTVLFVEPTPTLTPTITISPTATITVTPTQHATATPAASPTPVSYITTTNTFTYDGDGTMVKSVIDGVTTYYPSTSYEEKGGVVTKYYQGGAYRVGGVLYYSLTDQLGSTGVTVSDSGAKVAELRYDPWGEVRYANNLTPTDHTYTGQRSYSDNFGLMYYNARWYDSSIGRFAQADAVVPNGPQGYDHYAYVNNSPIMHNDPSGHNPITPYTDFIQTAINYFESQGYQIVGNVAGALAKSINANGADLVFQAKNSATVLAVELKNTAGDVNLGTLGKNAVGSYGGSIAQVVRSAARFVNSSNTQLADESQAIQQAYQSGNLQNALFTTSQNVSQAAQAQFNQVYTGITNNANKIIPPVATAASTASNFLQTLGSAIGSIDFIPMFMIDPRYFKDPSNPFYKPPLASKPNKAF
jgi:RHS repeat-associated protein